jgi:hypothetical protein
MIPFRPRSWCRGLACNDASGAAETMTDPTMLAVYFGANGASPRALQMAAR